MTYCLRNSSEQFKLPNSKSDVASVIQQLSHGEMYRSFEGTRITLFQVEVSVLCTCSNTNNVVM